MNRDYLKYKEGDLVVCVKANTTAFTLGKTYTVISSITGSKGLVDDYGNEVFGFYSVFTKVNTKKLEDYM